MVNNKKSVKWLMIYLIGILFFVICIVYSVAFYEKGEWLVWDEADDYDHDQEWDGLHIERYISDDTLISNYTIDFSSGKTLRTGLVFHYTSIYIQCADLTGDGNLEVIVQGSGSELNPVQNEIAIYKEKGNGYERMKLPIPESYGVQGGNQPYAMGYDIYVLNVAGHIATVGNEEAGIKAQFAIPQKMVESEEWGEIPLGELYLKAAQQQRIVGNTVWKAVVKDYSGKTVLESRIVLSPEWALDTRGLFFMLGMEDDNWVVYDSYIYEYDVD